MFKVPFILRILTLIFWYLADYTDSWSLRTLLWFVNKAEFLNLTLIQVKKKSWHLKLPNKDDWSYFLRFFVDQTLI